MQIQDLIEELGRLLKKLNELDPASKEYADARTNFCELLDAFHSECKIRDDDLNNELKRKLEEAKQRLAEKEAADRLKIARLDALISLAKIGLTITGTLAAIVLTASLEEGTILNKTCLAWIKAILPRT